ncbi:hypothetical protein CO669_32380 [Bradyrhizobium sp. Y36]|uniref:hypothetical protein n=1 Tax=Bradyrhizobium sp. Y36 TaxID=2035447 RepID=UPI000BE94EF0|nr:hypothetical protein [Bradyrhizobium sp. Y36]PDT84025.1 hypothetical protein CO669_32380 [Bradyrhizobium sp. Y36]
MIRPFAISLLLMADLACSGAVAQVAAKPETFTGINRKESVRGRPETATVSDGKSFVQLTERDYRAGGFRPPYETLPTIVVRRLPVRSRAPASHD